VIKPFEMSPSTSYLWSVVLQNKGQKQRLDSTELKSLGMPHTLSVLGKAEDADTKPPELMSLDFQPRVVDPTLCNTITFTAKVKDEQSGFNYALLRCRKEGERFTFGAPSASFGSSKCIGGNSREGTYRESIPLKPFALAPGTRYFWTVKLQDTANNKVELSSDELAARGFPHVLEVVGSPADADTTPPALLSFDFQPRIIDPAVTNKVTFTAHIVDSQSGFDQAMLTSRKDGEQFTHGAPSISFGNRNRTAGDEKDGMYRATLVLKPGQVTPGVTYLWQVKLYDVAANKSEMKAEHLSAKGMPTALQVAN